MAVSRGLFLSAEHAAEVCHHYAELSRTSAQLSRHSAKLPSNSGFITHQTIDLRCIRAWQFFLQKTNHRVRCLCRFIFRQPGPFNQTKKKHKQQTTPSGLR